MTTFRFHFLPSQKDGQGAGRLFIRVIHCRRYKDIVRPYRVTADEWEPVSRTLRIPDASISRKIILQDISLLMQEDISRIESIVSLLTMKGSYSVQDIADEFAISVSKDTLICFAEKTAKELSANNQLRTARAYRSASRSLTDFTGRDIHLCDITPAIIREYEQYLFEKGLQMNTVSFYMRNLRAIYYRAVKAGIIAGCSKNPFEDVFTGVYETKRRALDRVELEKLAGIDKVLSAGICDFSPEGIGRCQQFRQKKDALQYFMFAFHSRGMSFIDLAHLKKSELNGDTIIYKRKKTGYFIEVKVTKPMKKIMSYFKSRTKGSQYVFPIIQSNGVSQRHQYESSLTRQNRLLKELAMIAGIGKNLSTHVARHTWATLAKRMGYSIPLISEGLGHRDIKVTSTYLASFEKSALDELSIRMSKSVRAA